MKRYITVSELSLADIGKMVHVGDMSRGGVVSGRLYELEGHTEWISDYTYDSRDPVETPGRRTYDLRVGIWEATDVPSDLGVTIED